MFRGESSCKAELLGGSDSGCRSRCVPSVVAGEGNRSASATCTALCAAVPQVLETLKVLLDPDTLDAGTGGRGTSFLNQGV